MRHIFDHNLSPRLVARLADLFRDGLGVARAGVPVVLWGGSRQAAVLVMVERVLG